MVLACLRERIRLRTFTANPRPLGLQHAGDGDVVLGQPGPEPRVAVDDTSVEAHVHQVAALEVHVDTGAAVDERGLHGAGRVDQPDDRVVDQLAPRTPHDDAPGSQRVPPLVLHEVVPVSYTHLTLPTI